MAGGYCKRTNPKGRHSLLQLTTRTKKVDRSESNMNSFSKWWMPLGLLCAVLQLAQEGGAAAGSNVTGYLMEWAPDCNTTGTLKSKTVLPFDCVSGWTASGESDEATWYSFGEVGKQIDVFVFKGSKDHPCRSLSASYVVDPKSCISTHNFTVDFEQTTCYAGQEGDRDVFTMPSLPPNCSNSFQLCKSLFCSCVGLASSQNESCSFASLGVQDCNDVLEPCAADYIQCVNATYFTSNCDEGGPPTSLTPINVTSACLGFACELGENVSCGLNSSICYVPALTDGGSLPASVPDWTMTGSSTALQTTAVLTLAGDFSSFASASSSRMFAVASTDNAATVLYNDLVNALEASLRSAIGVGVLVTNAVCTGQDVTVTFVFQTPPTGSVQRIVLSNVARLGSFPSNWLDGVLAACQQGGGCAGGLAFGRLVSISTTTVTLPTSTPSPVVQTCSSGCVAGILVAAAFIFVVCGGLLYYVLLKARKRKDEKWKRASRVVEVPHDGDSGRAEENPTRGRRVVVVSRSSDWAATGDDAGEDYEELPQRSAAAEAVGRDRAPIQWTRVFGSRRRLKST